MQEYMADTQNVEYVRVTMVCSYALPADLAERMSLYDTIDPAECVRLGMENDPAAFALEAGIEIVDVQNDGSGATDD